MSGAGAARRDPGRRGGGRWSARTSVGLLLASLCCACGEPRADTREPPTESATSAFAPRSSVRAFYSGHSLSEGVPELVAEIARARGQGFVFEVQTLGYSLLRERTLGRDPARAWSGYRLGDNRVGSGLDVASELRAPTRLAAGERYDVLVVTERHDLPWAALHERTPTYLAHMSRQLLAGNPRAEVFFYHTWLELNPDAPLAWVAYEREVRRLWECVASKVNRELGAPRVRVLPGASALAELVEALWEGKVPGLEGRTPSERVRVLFADSVHPSPIGRYFLALTHYAALFGESPRGAPPPAGLGSETAAYLQELAARHVSAYGRIADASARRDMAACREFAAQDSCASYHALRAGSGPLGSLKRLFDTFTCRRGYRDEASPDNPFR